MQNRERIKDAVRKALESARSDEKGYLFVTGYQLFELLDEATKSTLLEEAQGVAGGKGSGTSLTGVGFLSEVLGNELFDDVDFAYFDARNVRFVLHGEERVEPGNSRWITLYRRKEEPGAI